MIKKLRAAAFSTYEQQNLVLTVAAASGHQQSSSEFKRG